MQKRLLLSLVLSIGFMFLWTQLGQRMGYYDETQSTENTPVTEEGGVEPLPETSVSAAEESPPASSYEGSDVVPAAEPEVVVERRSDTLENGSIRVVFDNLGGHLYDVVLHKVFQTSKRLDPVRLMKADKSHPGTLVFDDQTTDKGWLYTVEASGDRIVYTCTKGPAKVTKTFSLGDGYQLNCEVSYEGAASQNFMMVVAEGLQPIGADEEIEPSLLSMGAINPKMMQFAWSEAGSHESDQVGKPEGDRFEPALEEEASIEWLGVKDNYFANVFLPSTPVTNIYRKSLNTFPGQEPITLPVVAIRAEGSLGGKFYLGPMIEEDLKAVDPRLENLITYGWAGLLSKWLLAGLIISHNITNNWGWAIVILTLFIRSLMIPLTIPSVKSSFKMRKIQPKIEKLKEKFSGTDMETKQKLSQATFALYKTEGVNPFSSCLTALAQMPVFFAYFSLLRSSSSLRQAEWMGWIHDLSVRDSTFVLPIIMGVTMFLSTLAMPMPSADPAQAKMMKFMPLIFSFMFINMPAGLILYMITSNLFTLGQTKFLQRRYSK